MDNSQLVVALVGVSLLILAARGSLATAWSTLLGSSPPAPQYTLACQDATGTVTCAASPAACLALPGKLRPDLAGQCGPNAPPHVATFSSPGPGPGAPGSGVTTQ